LFMCSPITDGAAAVILASEGRARELTDKPVWIRGTGQALDGFQLTSLHEDYAHWPALKRAARTAYTMAGVGPHEVDVAEVHDCFAIAELIAYEELGFCHKGEAGPFAAAGRSDYGGRRVLLVDVKERAPEARRAVFTDARREIARDLKLMAEEGVIEDGDVAPALDRVEDRVGLDGLDTCGFVQEALPELLDLKRDVLRRLSARVDSEAIIASTSSTISPAHLADAVQRPERFLGAHWLNP